MEVICSSETSIDTQRTTRRYIPEDGTLHNHRCENLKSCKMEWVWGIETGLIAYTMKWIEEGEEEEEEKEGKEEEGTYVLTYLEAIRLLGVAE
jgi:hypothetical protein